MACLLNWIVLVGLASLSLGQDSGTSASSTITTSSSSTASPFSTVFEATPTQRTLYMPHPLSSYVWHVPFLGMSDNASRAWGPFGWDIPQAYHIIVDDGKSSSPSDLTRDLMSEARAEFEDDEDVSYLLDLDTSGGTTMTVGPNASLNATFDGVALNETVPTVPFGLNLGQNGTWLGSLILGGSKEGASYDASRVANGTWVYVPESSSNNGTFLKTGKQQLSSVTVQQYGSSTSNTSHNPFNGADMINQPATYGAVLDVNHDAIVLPDGFNLCNRTNFTVTLNARSIQINGTNSYENKLVIQIPTSLTRSADRCYTSNGTSGTIILGRPFFQAAYLMVPDTTGQIWLTAAHQYDVFPRSQLFFPNQTLIAAADPSPPPSPSPKPRPSSSANADEAGSKKRTASIVGGTLGAVVGLAAVSWAAFLLWRRRRAATEDVSKAFSSDTELVARYPGDFPAR